MLKVGIGNGELEVESGKSVKDIVVSLKENPAKAKELGVSALVNDVTVAALNGKLCDLTQTITENTTLTFYPPSSPEGLETIRHSASHIMAQAVLRLFPKTKIGIGPSIKDGFYYDMEFEKPIVEADLEKIEAEMKKIVEENIRFERSEMKKSEAIEFFKKLGQSYKVELISELEGDTVSLYKQGEFTDLCRGPHIPSTKSLKAFKLLSLAGAYWRGSEKNAMLTRIYGTAFADKKALTDYLTMMEEAKKRDHRKIGKEMGLFSFHEEGPGLPFWKPKGLIIKTLMIELMREKHALRNYLEIETPTILRDNLWKISGHMDNYQENMFFTEKDEENYAMKPMNCPGGIMVYKEELHSYKELPLKVAEFGKVHRFERSGVLQGLFRARGFTQDDAHIFCTLETLQDSVIEVIQLVDEVYKSFGYEYMVELSTRPEKSMGSDEVWEVATAGLKNALDKLGMNYKINEGDGAFYGPKIDYHLKDAIGRTHQCGTIQLDMNLPERFDMTYVGEDGKEHRVIMLHRAIYGSLERFIGILIEHYAGKFPFWLSPLQISILPVSDRFNDKAREIEKLFKSNKFRVNVDDSNEKLGYKIRKAQMEKTPYMLVLGEKEAEDGTLSVRHRDKGDLGVLKVSDLLETLLVENKNRV